MCGQEGKRGKAPKQKPAVFMIIRWMVMIAFAFLDDMGRSDIRTENGKSEHTRTFLSVEYRADDRIKLLLSFTPE